MNVTVSRLTGEALATRLDDLAKLRIEVFRAWPYLYKGTMAYERQYLPRYAETKTGTLIVAQNEDGRDANVREAKYSTLPRLNCFGSGLALA